jgi:hypothetical protein
MRLGGVLVSAATTCAIAFVVACATSGPAGGFLETDDDAGMRAPDARPDAPPAEAGADAAGDAQAAPPIVAPTDARDRFGVYAWGFDDTSWPGSPDRLQWAAGKVTSLGGRTVRVYLGPQDIYQVLPGGTFDLATAAASPAYQALFANPMIQTYLLTTYSSADDAGNWTAGYAPSDAAAERQEIAKLGEYLLQTYPGKTFVLLDWEGDNAIAPVASNDSAWNGFVAWTNARAAGVVDARQAAGKTTARLYSGVEFNLLRSAASQAPCDASANRCVVSAVLPKVHVDYFSYSSWDALAGSSDSQVAAQLASDLDAALGWAKMGDPTVTPARFIVGEFGAPRDQQDLGECAAMTRTGAILGAIGQWGASYGIFWQIIDNSLQGAAGGGLVTGFGLYKADGSAALGAALFETLYQTQTPTPPNAPSCPSIKQGGVVDGTNYKATDIHPTTTLSIFGSSFSGNADVVHVRQPGTQWSIQSSSTYWYDSTGQINATLPGVKANQSALVYVTDGAGVDSNGQVVSIVP